MSRREKTWLAVILAVAALTRLGAAVYMGDRVEPLPGIYDQLSYDALARSLLAGHGYSFDRAWWPATAPNQPTSFWSFLYPLYLAGTYTLFGPHPLAARIIQGLLLGPLTAWLLYRLGRRLFSPTVGLVAAAISSFYIYFAYYDAALMTESVYIAAILGAMVLTVEIAERPSWGKWLALGLVLGVATLQRQVVLLFLPFLLGWLLWAGRKRFRWWSILAPLLILMLTLLPWTVRNYTIFHRFVLLNTNAGFAFYWANHPIYGTNFALLSGEGPSYQDLIPTELRSLNEADMDSALLRRGIGFVWEDPGRYVLLSLSRIPEYFKFWPSPESSTISNISRVGSFGIFLPFMLYGLVLSIRRWRAYILPYLFIVVYSGIHVLSWVMIRYRLPVDAVLIPFAGLAIVDLAQRIARRWFPKGAPAP